MQCGLNPSFMADSLTGKCRLPATRLRQNRTSANRERMPAHAPICWVATGDGTITGSQEFSRPEAGWMDGGGDDGGGGVARHWVNSLVKETVAPKFFRLQVPQSKSCGGKSAAERVTRKASCNDAEIGDSRELSPNGTGRLGLHCCVGGRLRTGVGGRRERWEAGSDNVRNGANAR